MIGIGISTGKRERSESKKDQKSGTTTIHKETEMLGMTITV
jgi:hypothetical protein